MKKILFFVLSLCVVASCYDDSALWEEIKDHENRIVKLETLCNQMNTNITSLQTIVTALQSNDFITNVSPVNENGKEIGYTITFSKSGTITIYHGNDGKDGEDGADGKDGKDGTDGQDGTSPVIGVKQDSDGIYYWTLNGVWILDDFGNKIPTTGKSGKDGIDGEDGEDGADGKDGTDGKDGEDGITPKLKIEEGYWYVSYDNGASWERLEKAVEESDECFFKNVSQEEDAVHFTLTDGTVISIPLRQVLSISFDIHEITEVTYNGYTCCVPYVITGFVGKYEIGITNNTLATIEQNEDGTGEIILQFNDPGCRTTVYVSNNGHSVLKTLEIEAPIIEFKDEAVGAAFIDYNDNNMDGKFSLCEAASVTDYQLAHYAPFPKEGKSFEEFQYFTSVTKVPDSYFAHSMLEEVILPDSITEIGQYAFADCSSLKELEIPEGVTEIKQGTFYGCTSLKELEIPEGVTEIKQSTFYGCTSLQRLKIPSTVVTIDLSAFGYDTSSDPLSLSVIEVAGIDDWMNINFIYYNQPASFPLFGRYNIFPELVDEDGNSDYIIPEGTTVVMPGPLTGMGIKTITLPSSVTTIEDGAFNGCRLLEKINIPSSVKSIGASAFSGCVNLKEIHVSSFEEWLDIEFENVYSNPLVVSSGVLIDKNGNHIKAVSLPEGTTVIKSGIFTGFDDIEHITIPSTVTTIEANAFAGCANLKEITLPEGVESIGNNAFTNCSNLKEVTLPKSIRSIGADAFSGCVSVEKVYIENIEHWLNIEFGNTRSNPMFSSIAENGNAPVLIDSNSNQITNIDIPEGTTVVECGPYCGLVGLQTLEIPSSVTTIEPYAFEGCVNLSKVTIPSSLTSYESAFANMSLQISLKNLKEVVFSEGLSIISSNAFFRCVGIEEVTIPSSVKTIGDWAFSSCTGLSEITLSEGLETIGQSAFSNCTGLSEITIPSSVKTIGIWAFSKNEPKLYVKLYFRSPTPPVLVSMFGDGYGYLADPAYCKIYVPYDAVGAYKSAESWAYHRDAIIGYDFENNKVVE